MTIRVIPCLDCMGETVVKGVKFVGLRTIGSAVELAARYADEGADELVLLDIGATPEGRNLRLDVIQKVRRVLNIPLTAGGGVRGVEDAERMLNAGADKVAINSAAVRDPSLIAQLSEKFGAQCTVVAIDTLTVDGVRRVSTHGARENTALDAVEWASKVQSLGAGELLITSIDRDGTSSGYDTEGLTAFARVATIPIIASGGAASADHMIDALRAGASAVLTASILHDRVESIASLKRKIREAGFSINPTIGC